MRPGNRKILPRDRMSLLASGLLALASWWGGGIAAGQDDEPPEKPPVDIDPTPVENTPRDGSPGNAVTDETGPAVDNAAALESAKARLEALTEGGKADSAEITSARGLVEILQATVDAERKIADYQARIDAAPQEREATERRRAELESATPETLPPGLTLSEIKEEITRRVAALNKLREEAAGLASTIERRQSRRSRIRTETASIADRIASNESASAQEIDHREQRIARRRLETRVLETERTLYDATDDLLRDRQRLLSREIDLSEKTLEVWTEKARALESQDLKSLLDRAISIRDAENNPLLATVAGRNVELAERLLELTQTPDNTGVLLAKERARLAHLRPSRGRSCGASHDKNIPCAAACALWPILRTRTGVR